MGISSTFNINDIYVYYANSNKNLRMNFSKEDENDVANNESDYGERAKDRDVNGTTLTLGHKGKVTSRPK